MKRYLLFRGDDTITVEVKRRHDAYRLTNPAWREGDRVNAWHFHAFPSACLAPLALALLRDAGVGPDIVLPCAEDLAHTWLARNDTWPLTITSGELLMFAGGWASAIEAGRLIQDVTPPSPDMSEGGF